MTEPVKKGMFKIVKIFGWGTLVSCLIGVGAIGQIFQNNTEVCKNDVPKMKEAIIKTSVGMEYLTKEMSEIKKGQEDLTKAIKDAFPIYAQNQSLARPLQEPKIETAQMMQLSEWKNL